MTEQVYFNYNPFHLTRLILNMYMNKELNNFGNTRETYYMQKAVQDTTEYVSDEFLENIMESIAKEHNYNKEFNIANHIDIIFDRIIKTEEFKEYLKESEPDKQKKVYAWRTAIGLQDVDGLKPSQYLIETATQNIEGYITIEEALDRINTYYEEKEVHSPESERTEEADKVATQIAQLLSETAFSFTPQEYISIHRKSSQGIYPHAGKIREYNITKKEWVLDGDTILYGSASELEATLEYDFSREREFSYKGLTMEEIIHHLAVFISRLWQIHIFGEGNTRTTAVFFIKYLRTLGFTVTNESFAEHSWYFRNALVRANYTNLPKGIHETTEYLELFLKNLLLNENHLLSNRDLRIHE